MNHTLSQETHRQDQAQQRLRMDVGDLRAAVVKASECKRTNTANIREELCTEVVRLTSALQKLRADVEADVARMAQLVETEVAGREGAVQALDKKVDREDSRLQDSIKANLKEFE